MNLLMLQGDLTVGVAVTPGTNKFDLNNDNTLTSSPSQRGSRPLVR